MSLILPSFELIPGKFNVGSLFAQIPMDGSADLTVTRGSDATRFNASGNVQVMGSGIPRLDYYTSGGVTGCPALLVEPSGTNLFSRSNDFLNSDWVKVRATITSGTTTSPDGTLNASTINCDASGTAGCWVRQTVALSSERTASIFVKPNTAQFFQIHRDFGVGVVFNLASGTIKESVTATGTITPFPNGWYRCTAHFSGAGDTLFLVGNLSMTVTSWSSNLNESLFIYQAQIEAGTIATSVIPTTAGTGSRSADVISVSGAVSGAIGQTEGTIYLEVEAPNASQQVFAIGTGGTNSIHIYKISSNQYRASINGQSGGGSVDLTDSIARTGFVKLAVAYKSGESALVVNGSTPVTSATSLTFGALTSVNFFGTYQAALPFRVRAAALYTTRLTNETLAFMTSPYTTYQQMASQLNYTSL